jgi:hypothetical protein
MSASMRFYGVFHHIIATTLKDIVAGVALSSLKLSLHCFYSFDCPASVVDRDVT